MIQPRFRTVEKVKGEKKVFNEENFWSWNQSNLIWLQPLQSYLIYSQSFRQTLPKASALSQLMLIAYVIFESLTKFTIKTMTILESEVK